MDVTQEILQYAAEMFGKIRARAILVYADVFSDPRSLRAFLPEAGPEAVVLATREQSRTARGVGGPARLLKIPGIPLTRFGQIKVAMLLGFCRGLFRPGDRLVCLSGVAGSGVLDTVMFVEVGQEFELFAQTGKGGVAPYVNPEVFERVLDVATTLAHEGREGKAVGTAFVVGDVDAVRALSAQMILNPFKGYAEEERNILDPTLEETVKEFAAIDGAFMLRGDGLIEAAGVYLKPGIGGPPLPPGLGARHKSAAGITAATNALAVAVSESSGTVTVFQKGKILIEVERPRPLSSDAAQGRRVSLRRKRRE